MKEPLNRKSVMPDGAAVMKRAVVLLGVLAAMSASAYVLPGGCHPAPDDGGARGAAVLHAEGGRLAALLRAGGEARRERRWACRRTGRSWRRTGRCYLKLPGRCRFEAKAREGNTVASVSSGGRKRVEGTEIPSLSEAVQQVCAVLGVRAETPVEGREAVEAHLRSLGIEARTTSLARFGGDVVYVLGQQAEGKPQFWVYKDGFRPARLKYKDGKGTAWDVRFLDYTSPATGEMLPRTIEVWRGEDRVLRFTVLTGDTRAKLADTLF